MDSRDTRSTTCVVKSSSVKHEQMTGSYELCMLIDGVVKRYLTAVMDLKFWHPILYWHGKSVVHGHTSPGHNCWQYTRCSWPRHRHKTMRCQIYITMYRRYTTEHRQSVETVPETDCLAECAHLTITVSQIEQDIGWKSSFSHSPLAFDAPVKGVPNFPSEHRHPV